MDHLRTALAIKIVMISAQCPRNYTHSLKTRCEGKLPNDAHLQSLLGKFSRGITESSVVIKGYSVNYIGRHRVLSAESTGQIAGQSFEKLGVLPRLDNRREKHGEFGCVGYIGLLQHPSGGFEHFQIKRVSYQLVIDYGDSVARNHPNKNLGQRQTSNVLDRQLELSVRNDHQAPHIQTVLGQRSSFVEANAIDGTGYVDRSRTRAVYLFTFQSTLRHETPDCHGSWQRRRHHDGDEIQRFQSNVAAMNTSHSFRYNSINNAETSYARQQYHKLVRVLLELEIYGRRIHNGPHQAALAGVETCSDNYRQYLMT